jgi:Protein of unknown function (DUF2934)
MKEHGKQAVAAKAGRHAGRNRAAGRRVPHPQSVPIPPSTDDPDAAPDQPFAEGAQDAIDADLRHRMISEAAYHRYTERGYADGYDLDDWLQAEAQVDHLLLNGQGQG